MLLVSHSQHAFVVVHVLEHGFVLRLHVHLHGDGARRLELMGRNRNFQFAITDRFDAARSATPLDNQRKTDVSWIANENDVIAIERQEFSHPEYGETRIVLENASLADAFRDQFESGRSDLRDAEKDRRAVMERGATGSPNGKTV